MVKATSQITHIHFSPNSDMNQGQAVSDETDMEKYQINNTYTKTTVLLSLWYFFSFTTIVLNKYILATLGGNASFLGQMQMLMSVVFGGISIYALPCISLKRTSHSSGHKCAIIRNMSVLGCLRFGTVVCSLISLKHVAVSFTETIKASAPLFTVILSFIILREKVGLLVMFSLIPIMAGLFLCSANELSFNLIGFTAAISNNLMDCIQNVFSKKLLSGDTPYSPPELQFFTGAAALLFQIPFWMYLMDFHNMDFSNPDYYFLGILMLDSFSFYLQSVTAYGLMALISPITFSVANTVKRTLLIWLSVLVFANTVTWLSGLGTMIVTMGVIFYQNAKHNAHITQECEQKLPREHLHL